MRKVSKDGVITIGEAKGMDTTIDVVQGMQFDRGYISPYFVTNTEEMLVDEMLAICSNIEAWKKKKESQEAQWGYTRWLNSETRWKNEEEE